MHALRKSQDGGHESPTAFPAAGVSARLEGTLSVFNPEARLWGWASSWVVWSDHSATLIAIPRLNLTHSPVTQLVHQRAFPDVFTGCRFCGPGVNFVEFHTLAASFPLYRDGQPEVRQMLAVLHGGSGTLAKLLRVGSRLLT